MASALRDRDLRTTADRIRVYLPLTPAVFLIGTMVLVYLRSKGILSFSPGVLWMAVLALALATMVVAELLLLLSGRVAGGFARVVFAQGRAEPASTFSYEESLIVRGRFGEADEALAARAAQNPQDGEVLIRRAELHQRKGDGDRAERYFRDAQQTKLPNTRDIYVSLCLIDHYRDMDRTSRLRVELQRLADKYPGSAAAHRALQELAELPHA